MSLKQNFYLLALAALLTALNPGNAAEEQKFKELWFPVGEALTYKIYWGILPVAETRVTAEWIEEEEDENTRILLAFKVVTRSYTILDVIYPVNDYIESIVDPETFLPLRFVRRLSEGRYRLYEITTFNHKAHTAHWKHMVKKDEKDFAIEDNTRDLLSFMYFMRSQKLDPNQSYTHRLMADEKLYDLFINTRDYVNLSIPGFGRFQALYIVPEAKFQGFFVRVGKLQVWIADDKRCLCVKAMAKAPVIGTIKLLLDKVEGPGNDAWVKGRAQAGQPRTSETNAGGIPNAN
jgi:hypothetical protein